MTIQTNDVYPDKVSPQCSATDTTDNHPAAIKPEDLGSTSFRRDYGIKYAYLGGAMYKGIASKELVTTLGKAGLMGYLGTGGMSMEEIESSIQYIQSALPLGQSYGMNLLANTGAEREQQTVDLYLKYGIRYIEASSYMQLSPSIVHYRLKGIRRKNNGLIEIPNRIMAKISRPEVAEAFMRPAPLPIVQQLKSKGLLNTLEAELSQHIPMCHEICVEADSGGHTDQGVAYALLPAISSQRENIQQQQGYSESIRVGTAGGIGTPASALAAFMLGADFIMTGSINQCTVEAGTSDTVKDMLQGINVQDTAYAPAGDLFELGAKVQVLKKGVFFPARANKLYELYTQHNSLDEIDEKTRKQIEEKYFMRSFQDVWEETRNYYAQARPRELAMLEQNPKLKMAAIFRWYFVHTSRLALNGDPSQQVNYQVHTGPALGAFNQWVKGTNLENWRQRHVHIIAENMMQGAVDLLNQRLKEIGANY